MEKLSRARCLPSAYTATANHQPEGLQRCTSVDSLWLLLGIMLLLSSLRLDGKGEGYEANINAVEQRKKISVLTAREREIVSREVLNLPI